MSPTYLVSPTNPSMSDLIDRGYIADWKTPTHDRFTLDMRIKTHAYAAYSANPNYTVYKYEQGNSGRGEDTLGLEGHSRPASSRAASP